MQIYTGILATLIACLAASAQHGAPSICGLAPLATILPGQSITATVDNPQGRPCEAIMVFADDNFLPVTFSFEPGMCLGYQRAEIMLPSDAPNGVVTVLWQCAGKGTRSCSRLEIAGGPGNPDGLESHRNGTMECLVPTATFTTLSTSIRGTQTLVENVVGTEFSTSTVLPSTPSSSLIPASALDPTSATTFTSRIAGSVSTYASRTAAIATVPTSAPTLLDTMSVAILIQPVTMSGAPSQCNCSGN
ncbi:uncharacterized protein BP5553_01138 [Venustampulla echinocandica]|uniref:Uncharacterized protein n=1 Tax=Venustampulla echinocandica TaxID=2656787 RepID=A0A370U057_9HELO|nr:uncharacterized protein BP5553_01138 [Venustampulla echinocandica]RDL41159.1 hypothetical protein BP5553_01138 [Venustampulla echinocandica]